MEELTFRGSFDRPEISHARNESINGLDVWSVHEDTRPGFKITIAVSEEPILQSIEADPRFDDSSNVFARVGRFQLWTFKTESLDREI